MLVCSYLQITDGWFSGTVPDDRGPDSFGDSFHGHSGLWTFRYPLKVKQEERQSVTVG